MLTVDKIMAMKKIKKPIHYDTVYELADNSEKYEDVYRQLVKAATNQDWVKRDMLIEIEEALSKTDEKLREKLGILVPDPCGPRQCSRFRTVRVRSVRNLVSKRELGCPYYQVIEQNDKYGYCNSFKMKVELYKHKLKGEIVWMKYNN